MNKKAESPEQSRRVAIFDIDGTIFRSSLLIEVVNALMAKNIFPEKAQNIYAVAYKNWLNRKGSYDAYIKGVVEAFEKYIQGVAHEDFKAVCKQVVDFHEQRTYVYTRDLVKYLKKQGYFILAISHSPKELLDEFCSRWGFDKVYGRMYEVDIAGKFTGDTLYKEEINDKAKILKRFIEKEKLRLADSYGVGDSESDIKFLTFVENPICFNPNKILYEHAKKHGWKVVVERKDVIYEVD
jgi:HAD superfamily hydrolase (TIGR01490 family)